MSRLTDDQVNDAVSQMLAQCRHLSAGEYQMVTARGMLTDLGFEADVDAILQRIAGRGFNYCLDPAIRDHNGKYPPRNGCTWGVDQFESRLQCVKWSAKWGPCDECGEDHTELADGLCETCRAADLAEAADRADECPCGLPWANCAGMGCLDG